MDWEVIAFNFMLLGAGYALALLIHWPFQDKQPRDSKGRFTK